MKSNPVLAVLWIFSFLLLTACVKNEEAKSIGDLAGKYVGTDENGKAVSFEIIVQNESQFSLNNFRGITYPFTFLEGELEENELVFLDYECIDCPFLSSPGGTSRTYTATVKSSGVCYPENDSLVLEIDYLQTGMGASAYQGPVFMKKTS